MYDELVKALRERANALYNASRLYDSDAEDAAILYKAADAIEELNRKVEDFEAMREISPEAEYAINKHADNLISKLDKLISDSEDKPREVKINLNELVKVRLTDLGKDIYYHRYDELFAKSGRTICKPTFPKEDEKGYTHFQLWEFIKIYGNHIGLLNPNVIEPLKIIYEPPKEET